MTFVRRKADRPFEGVAEGTFQRRQIMNTQASLLPVTRELVPEDRRMSITERLFGMAFPLQLEPVIYGITDRMADSYSGAYWTFYTLSNGGFYMAPASDDIFHVTCANMFEGDLSADALGITSCLYAYSHLSFNNGGFSQECARQYYLLREYMMEHPEVREILGATD
jgi:hypothetical protein